tara:strand:+ start:503 stop:700 length:198 start_codon:yes stop_codon:yes gene_type:complete
MKAKQAENIIGTLILIQLALITIAISILTDSLSVALILAAIGYAFAIGFAGFVSALIKPLHLPGQ